MLLGSDDTRARARGGRARQALDENANRERIIKQLVTMLQENGSAAQEQAAAALANLARESEDNRKSIVDAGGINPLLLVLESTSAKAKENAVGAIKGSAATRRTTSRRSRRRAASRAWSDVMSGFGSNTIKDAGMVQLCTLAAEAIKEMAKGNRKNQDAIAEKGAIHAARRDATALASRRCRRTRRARSPTWRTTTPTTRARSRGRARSRRSACWCARARTDQGRVGVGGVVARDRPRCEQGHARSSAASTRSSGCS